METIAVVPSSDFKYYNGTIYWNNFDIVNYYLNKMISGEEHTNWMKHFVQTYGLKKDVFVINCGNGWVERELFKSGGVGSVVGADINQDLIDEAQAQASTLQMPAKYVVCDSNNFNADAQKYDLVLNHAAMHHVAWINRMAETVAAMTRGGGLFVNFDYVGPHRNQYDAATWQRCIEVKKSLPEKYRVTLSYPHVPTMIATDPTEAIHSELFVGVLQRHFDLIEYTKLGGGISYPLLFDNCTLLRDQDTQEGLDCLRMIIEEDEKWLVQHPSSNLFAFIVARPKRQQPSAEQLAQWVAEENEREAAGSANGGRYYPPTLLETVLYQA
jgi:ubiquinone/menaquinone biosynthesis C-methylase UbiE